MVLFAVQIALKRIFSYRLATEDGRRNDGKEVVTVSSAQNASLPELMSSLKERW